MSDRPVAIFTLRFDIKRGEYAFDQVNDHKQGASPHTEWLNTAKLGEAVKSVESRMAYLERAGIETRLVRADAEAA